MSEYKEIKSVEELKKATDYMTIYGRSYDPEKREFIMEVRPGQVNPPGSGLLELKFKDCAYVEVENESVDSNYNDDFPLEVQSWGKVKINELDDKYTVDKQVLGSVKAFKNDIGDKDKIYYFSIIGVVEVLVVCKNDYVSLVKN